MRFLAIVLATILCVSVAAGPSQQHVFTAVDAVDVLSVNSMPSLLKQIRSAKCEKSVAYAPVFFYPPLQWSRQAGIYDSYVHLNFHGAYPGNALLRNLYNFPDDNAFVTLFIVHSLVEVRELAGDDGGLGITDEELLSSIEAIGTHHDLNRPKVASLMNFWNQKAVVNGTHFRATPPNIDVPLTQLGNGISMIVKGIQALGLDRYIPDIPLDAIVGFATSFGRAFGIPPDADDTGCNLALGAKLYKLKNTHPRSFDAWKSQNIDTNGDVLKSFLKYAYRPFSKNYEASSIDPRTYFWIHPYLQELDTSLHRREKKSFALITTWMQSIDEVDGDSGFQRMPFNVNNIDVSVTANGLFGIVSYLFMNPSQLNSEVESLIMDNVDLLVWVLDKRIASRFGTMSLLYYPPKFAFFWFVARLANFMEETGREDLLVDSALSKLFQKASKKLMKASQKYSTKEILSVAKHESAFTFWDDFLGMSDTFKGKPKPLFEDRVFSTSMAVNALLDSWTYKVLDGSKTRFVYYANTPAAIVQTISGAASWLNTQAHKYPKENAFFSSSIKTGRGTACFYPHNSFKLANGTDLGKCSDYPDIGDLGAGNVFNLVAAVRGVMKGNEYETLLDEQVCLGKGVPVDTFAGDKNCVDCVFPYWSSPALTNTMHLLAAAKYAALQLV